MFENINTGWRDDLRGGHEEKHINKQNLGEKVLAQIEPYDQQDDEETLADDEKETVAAFAAHALRKQKFRERITQEDKHSDPEIPYRQQRKDLERESGHIGTSVLDVRAKTTGQQAIQQEFRDWDVESDDYDALTQAYEDTRNVIPESNHEKLSFNEALKKYRSLFTFLYENTTPNPNVETEYSAIKDKKQKLQYILDAPLADKVRLFCGDAFGFANYDNFMHKLQFQQDVINGKAKVYVEEWDSEKGEYIEVLKTLNPIDANKRDVALGLDRASLKAAMIGTPEYGAYKMALDIADSSGYGITSDFPVIRGYYSGIYKTASASSIGDWRLIIDEYQEIAKGVAKRRPDLAGENLEYRTVRDAAQIFANSMNYNPTGRGRESPYVSSFHESVVWAQLGEGAKRQLRGMRQRIYGADLDNIGRFLGRSGRSEQQESRIKELTSIERTLSEQLLNIKAQNEKEIAKQNLWHEKETARINHKYDKLISKTRSAERNAEYERRRAAELENVNNDVAEKIAYFENRTDEQFREDMRTRAELLEERIDKRKSIAEKAIELHFALMPKYNNENDDNDNDNQYLYAGIVDWINDAPFGTIKRAHRRLKNNIPADDISKMAITEIVKKAVNNPDQADTLLKQKFAEHERESKFTMSTQYTEIRDIVELAGKFSKYPYKLSYSELVAMNKHDTSRIEDSLAVFPFSDVKTLLNNDVDLSIAPQVSHTASKFGYDLDINQLINLSNSIGSLYRKEASDILATALRNFSLEEVEDALKNNINLKKLNAIKPVLSSQGITDFPDLLERAKELQQICEKRGIAFDEIFSEYAISINILGIDKANHLLSHGVNLSTFNLVAEEFGDILNDDFDNMVNLSGKVEASFAATKFDPDFKEDIANEKKAIRILQKLDSKPRSKSQILDLYIHSITADAYQDIFVKIGKEQESHQDLSFEDKIKLTQDIVNKYSTSGIRSSLNMFDDEVLKQFIERNIDTVCAASIKVKLDGDERFAGYSLKLLMHLAEIEADADTALNALDAGFSIAEIEMYPFLASNLLKKQGKD